MWNVFYMLHYFLNIVITVSWKCFDNSNEWVKNKVKRKSWCNDSESLWYNFIYQFGAMKVYYFIKILI